MLRGSLRLGSLLGVPIFIHWTFLLILAWFMAGPLLSGAPDALAASLRTGVFVLTIFGCVVLHEMGHALAARRYGIGTRDITLLPIGGVARLERMPEKPAQELIVAVAGPAVNVVIAAIIVPLVLVTDGTAAFTSGSESVALHLTNFFAALAVVNIFLVIFNMIPALPMDGGRVLRALMAMVMARGRATAVAARLGQLVAVGFALLGVFSGNILLVVIAAFVFLGAGGEAQAEQVRSALEGLPVRAAMLTRFVCLRASQSLRDAANELLAGSQHDFPVLSDGAESDDVTAIVGVLTRTGLVRALASGQLDALVSSAMEAPCPVVRENDDLRSALEQKQARAKGESSEAIETSPVIAVARDDPSRPGHPRFIGLITDENVTELVMLRGAVTSTAR